MSYIDFSGDICDYYKGMKEMVEVWLPYGKTEICARIPTEDLLSIVEPNKMDAAKNPSQNITDSLLNPFNTKRLADIVKPKSRVAVALRSTDISTNQMIVSAIMKELISVGIDDGHINIFVADDPLHKSLLQQSPVLGDNLTSRLKIERHESRTIEVKEVGKTTHGTTVEINKAFLDADVKILASVIEPHPFAGYSGGRDVILPGLSSLSTIEANMSLALNGDCRCCSLENNPLHEDMTEAAYLAKPNFSLNIVRNGDFEIVKAFSGDFEESFLRATTFAEKIFKTNFREKADLVFFSPGGCPFDDNLYESCLYIESGMKIMKKNKTCVLVAECPNGEGDKDFYESMIRYKEPKIIEKSLKKKFTIGGLVAHRFIKAIYGAQILLVSILPDYVMEAFGLKCMRSINEAYRHVFGNSKNSCEVSFMPRGNITSPVSLGGE